MTNGYEEKVLEAVPSSGSVLKVTQTVPSVGTISIATNFDSQEIGWVGRSKALSGNEAVVSAGAYWTLNVADSGINSYIGVKAQVLYVGISSVSSDVGLAQVNIYGKPALLDVSNPSSTGPHYALRTEGKGTLKFYNNGGNLDGYFYTFVPDKNAVGMNSQGLLVDSNVASSSSSVLYSKPAQALSQGDVAVSAVSAPSVVLDSGLILAVKNLTTTVDTSTFAIGSLANGIAHATVQLNNIKDVGQEILSLKADAQLFPDIYAATSSNGTLTLTSNGRATLAEWQAALRAVTYQDTAANPTTGVRTVTFDYNDGSHASYASSQDYVVVSGTGSSNNLRAAVEPNDPNSKAMIAFDTGAGQNAGEAYRLYKVFDREPDMDGVGFWIKGLDSGTKLKEVAQAFLSSDEFATRCGSSLSDEQYISTLYDNFFHRGPDQAGQAYWLSALKAGVSRADVLIGFSESPENVGQLAQLVVNGVQYQTVTS